MTENPEHALPSLPYRVQQLSSRKPTRFAFTPDAADRAAIAAALGLINLPFLSFKGEITPAGRADFAVSAALTAKVVQPCSITLAPVPASIDEAISRRFDADFQPSEGEEVELTADDPEPLPEILDIAAMAIEELALALPLYPRAAGAELGEAVFAAPGVEPLKQADLNPFAGLAGLAAKLKSGENGDS